MKKKKIELSKKLQLTKETVAELNAADKNQLAGGVLPTTTTETRQLSSCRATGRPCCMIP